MQITAGVILILTGIFSAFLSSVLTSLSQKEYNNIIEKKYSSAKLLNELKKHFESDISPFQIVEIGLYSIAGVLMGSYFLPLQAGIKDIIIISLIFSLSVLLLRYIMQAAGARNADNIALKMTPFMKLYHYAAMPLLLLFNFISEKIIGNKNDEGSRDEITALVEEAREDGSIDPGEYRIMKNIMHLEKILVTDVMTPRTVLFSLEAHRSVGKAVSHQELQMYSRFPVWQGESIDDDLVGYVMTRDVLQAALENRNDLKLREFARGISIINENVELDNALEMFLNKRQHQFIVVDEYGGVVGLLTMEDVLEAMLGVEIVDEADKFIDLRLLAKQRRDEKLSSISKDKLT